ncbi:hypothetical protein [Streptomyces sp. WZ-12]|uniref:hypothetical protein n=1 Tax=Streptomyces sp. WZ-12 TaxID=3030210 RepID=UPI002380FF0E|nr:hypothetical protein [Streptomyces sp. WZ-12]
MTSRPRRAPIPEQLPLPEHQRAQARLTIAEPLTDAVEQLELASTICHYTATGITNDLAPLHGHRAVSAQQTTVVAAPSNAAAVRGGHR